MRISEHAYAVTGLAAISPWAVNAGFAAGERATIIIDAGSNMLAAQLIHGYALAVSPKNSLTLLNTEPHFDHIGGNSYFRDLGVDIFAREGLFRTEDEFEATKKEFNEAIPEQARRLRKEAEAFYAGTSLANPNRRAKDGDVFDLGGAEARIIETPGHTPHNISLAVLPDRAVFCGDCVVSGYMPNLSCGSASAWEAWLASLDALERFQPSVLAPGHGNVIFGPDIPRQLERMRNILRRAIAGEDWTGAGV